jgi:hypothetical protein
MRHRHRKLNYKQTVVHFHEWNCTIDHENVCQKLDFRRRQHTAGKQEKTITSSLWIVKGKFLAYSQFSWKFSMCIITGPVLPPRHSWIFILSAIQVKILCVFVVVSIQHFEHQLKCRYICGNCIREMTPATIDADSESFIRKIYHSVLVHSFMMGSFTINFGIVGFGTIERSYVVACVFDGQLFTHFTFKCSIPKIIGGMVVGFVFLDFHTFLKYQKTCQKYLHFI